MSSPSTQKHLYGLIATFLILGGVIFGYKISILHLPIFPEETIPTWVVEAELKFKAEGTPIKAELWIPPIKQNSLSLLHENFVSRHYGLTTRLEADNRAALWTIRRAKGEQTLYYRATVVSRDNPDSSTDSPPAPILESAFEEGALDVAKSALIEQVRQESADSVTFAALVVKRLLDPQDGNAAILLQHDHRPEKIAFITHEVIKAARINSRILNGLILQPEQNSRKLGNLTTWLQIWNGKHWVGLDPRSGKVNMPQHFLVWWYGSDPVYQMTGARISAVRFSITNHPQNTMQLAVHDGYLQQSRWMQFSLLSLPLQNQQVYQVLLMVPIGALVIIFLRMFVGLPTFGTFMPVLVALAFRETELISGIVLFSSVVALGLSVRFYLEHLKLLVVPRLGLVLTIVIVLMALISIVSHRLDIENGMSIALFPMVILTMTIERMSIVWEERHPLAAIKQGVGSLMAASLSYLAMSNAYGEHLVFVFPELLFWVMALMLIMARYRGYRLSELFRFKQS